MQNLVNYGLLDREKTGRKSSKEQFDRFIAVKAKVGQMPAHATWKRLIAVACLGGIGFTMSIFVDTLSFTDQTPEVMDMLQDMGKVAVLMGSLCAGLLGSLLILLETRKEKKSTSA